jgi:hypothetical protein
MGTRKVQDTSREAFYSLDPKQLVGLRKKLLQALTEIKCGHYEDIARQAGIEPIRCWKRLSELNRDGFIHRTGERKPLASKRMGCVWAPGGTPEVTKKKERVMKGKTVADFSKAINQVKQSIHTQEKLF